MKSRTFAALCAALVAACLSLGGASLVIAGPGAGNGNGNGNGNASNGNAYGHDKGGDKDAAAPAPAPVAPAPAPAPSDSGQKGNGNGSGHGNGHAKHESSNSQPAAPKKQQSAPKHVSAPSTGGGSHSTGTSGPGNSGQGCDGTHHSDTGHGANQGGPYDNTCDGSPSGNGNGNGKATGKPCAGCVGNADDKNPGFNNGKGQMPNGSDHNAGYECDRNHGIGRSNPAHTGCKAGEEQPPTPPSDECKGDMSGGNSGSKHCDHPGENNGGGNCSGDMSGDNSGSKDCDHPGGGNEGTGNEGGCPDATATGSLTQAAAVALKVAALLHPELAKLADLATTKAAENCGHGSDNGNGHTPITICHATGSTKNPYVEITIDENGLNGHGDHADDIIPAPAGGCPKGETTPPGGGEQPGGDHGCPGGDMGGNGNGNGNGCGNDNEHGKITICHATGSATNPFVEITISENGLNGHGDHPDDIIPAPAGGCPTGSTTPPGGGEQPGGNTPPPTGGNNPETPVTPSTETVTPPALTTAPATETPAPATETPGQAVLGERQSGSSPAPATAPAGNEVLGENASGGSAPAGAAAPAAAQGAQPLAAQNEGGSLPFTGTDAMLVLFLGCLLVLGGVAMQRLTARRSN